MTFRVWAPEAKQVDLVLGEERVPLQASPGGWWSGGPAEAAAGTDYAFLVDGQGPVPDPRSRRQAHGVHGASQVYDHAAFPWTDAAWRGRALPGALTYELHMGTFTPEGTCDAAIDRLDHLVDLGVDLVEVLPVAAFPGRHGWGYDGVALYAVHEPYGGPDAFKRFVDACHGRGLGVVLDVVYNHLGPSGNYLSVFGPYFTDRHQTPWGAAVNLDDAGSDEVRRFICDNALSWLRDFHVDGLRLDAVHALVDDRATHVLEQLSREVDDCAAAVGRPLFLVAESDRNDPRTVTPREAGGQGLHAQWSDDLHHALHTILTGERQGYYVDFGSPECLAKTLGRVFFHDGTWSEFRGRAHGAPVDVVRTSGHRFLAYLQNHDQVGNRATGDRISATLPPGLVRVGAALVLTSPYSPMLFMGEEWAASTPWQYFTDHTEPELAEAVREGRRREFATHGWGPNDVPDPQHEGTLEASKLDWTELDREPHAAALAWYRSLVALRRARPELTDGRLDLVRVETGGATGPDDPGWVVVHRGPLRVAANLGPAFRTVDLGAGVREVLLDSEPVSVDGSSLGLPGHSVAIVEIVA